MVEIVGPPSSATRRVPISTDLRHVLLVAAEAAGLTKVVIVSGGQPSKDEGGPRTGSTRHDHGRAADVMLVQNGVTLTFTDSAGGPAVESFVTAAATAGATGIGAGLAYMGNKTIHVGFGTSPADNNRLVWGANGKSANAPRWLSRAAEKGWASIQIETQSAVETREPGLFVVAARNGVKLRSGPGTGFNVQRVLPVGTDVTVLGFDDPDARWARVSLDHDSLVDGHVFATFLSTKVHDTPI